MAFHPSQNSMLHFTFYRFRILSYICCFTSEFTLSSFNFPRATFKFLLCTFTFSCAIFKFTFKFSGLYFQVFATILARKNDGTEREAQGVGRDMSCPRKLFLDEQKSRFLAEVCFPRRPHTVLPRSLVRSKTSSAIK